MQQKSTSQNAIWCWIWWIWHCLHPICLFRHEFSVFLLIFSWISGFKATSSRVRSSQYFTGILTRPNSPPSIQKRKKIINFQSYGHHHSTTDQISTAMPFNTDAFLGQFAQCHCKLFTRTVPQISVKKNNRFHPYSRSNTVVNFLSKHLSRSLIQWLKKRVHNCRCEIVRL